MREARILRSGARFHGGGYRGISGGDNRAWQIALVLVFGILGTISLVSILLKLRKAKVEKRRSLIIYSAIMLLCTILFSIPAIVLLALNPTRVVGILSIVSIFFLVLPLLTWIPVAAWMSRHFEDKNEELEEQEVEELNADKVHTENEEADERADPAYNLVPEASGPTNSAAVDVEPQVQSSPSKP